jgi:hypothetical protein
VKQIVFSVYKSTSTLYRAPQGPWGNLLCLQQAELIVMLVARVLVVDSRYRLLQATWDYLDLLIVVVTSRLEVESVILRS